MHSDLVCTNFKTCFRVVESNLVNVIPWTIQFHKTKISFFIEKNDSIWKSWLVLGWKIDLIFKNFIGNHHLLIELIEMHFRKSTFFNWK